MSHVDEGTLHAYLDDELPSGERAAVDAHLAQCASCRALLGEERALLERASALLGSARPVERPVPPFERLRPAPRRRPWHVRTPVAWAASIVLALGVGYALRDSGLERAAPVAEESRAQPASDVGAFVPAQEKAAGPLASARTRRVPETRPPAPAPALGVARQEGAARDSVVAGVVAIQPQVQLRGASPAGRQREADSLAADRRLMDALEETRITAPAPPANAGAASVTIDGARTPRRTDARSVRNLLATTWPIISRGVAASMLGDTPVGVPGLATRQIRRNPTGDGTVVVEQALDSSTVIQIFQRPAVALQDSAFARLSSGLERERADRVLSRYVGRLRVEISGPVSTDSLNRLLEQVEPIP